MGIVGSPRKNGNTEILVNETLKGASEAGAETEVLRLEDMNINPCRACMDCKTNGGKCAIDDDMQTIYNKLKDNDALVLGSPIYMFYLSAQTKLFIDRLYAVFYTDFWEGYDKLNVSLVFTQGNPDEKAFKDIFDNTEKLFDVLGFNVKDSLVSVGNMELGDVKNKPDIIEKARSLGKQLAEN